MFRNIKMILKNKILLLRKTRSFLKSKVTRTRQWSKVIVFFGLWFNLGSIYFTFLYCYQFYFNIYEYWWCVYLVCCSFLFKLFINQPLFFANFFGKILLNFLNSLKSLYIYFIWIACYGMDFETFSDLLHHIKL